jgi:hypothetical protein
MTNSTNLVKELSQKKLNQQDSKERTKFSKNKNLITFLGAQKSNEWREALETPNKPCKTFRDTIETPSKLNCNFSIRKTQSLTFDQREAN